MGRVWVHADALASGELPDICCKTGESADQLTAWEFDSTPGWTWVLLLFGILPFLIARWFSQVSVFARLPMSTLAFTRLRRAKQLGGVSIITAAIFAVLGLLSSDPTTIIVAMILLVAAVVAYIAYQLLAPNGVPDRSHRWVQLQQVHPRFVRAVKARQLAEH